VRRASALLLLCLGCAHAPAHGRDGKAADERAVVLEFWADWCGPCHTFDREYLPDPALQRALHGVRFERYDVDSLEGEAKYRQLTGSPQKRVPMFVAMVGDRVVRQIVGLPRTTAPLIRFVEETASLGGSEAELRAELEAQPNESHTLMRAARFYAARRRTDVAAGYWARVIADDDAPAELRAEADWNRGRALRKGRPREARALVDFALAHAGTALGDSALAMMAILKDVSAGDNARALRAAYEAGRSDGLAVNDLVYHALAAHQYELALEFAQQAVRLLQTASAYDSLAEVHYYRQEQPMAISLGARACEIDPKNEALRENLARFRRADGSPCAAVENLRYNGLLLLPRFYGDVE
jgi:tetratricopeptide (TPR) repeat protein